MSNNNTPNGPVEVREVIITQLSRRGDGREKPVRIITEFWDPDGTKLAEVDPALEMPEDAAKHLREADERAGIRESRIARLEAEAEKATATIQMLTEAAATHDKALAEKDFQVGTIQAQLQKETKISERMKEAIGWALGEGTEKNSDPASFFAGNERSSHTGAFWWRGELRRRAGL